MKILIVGLGGIGQRHARNLRALLGENVDLIAYRVRRFPGLITASLDVDRQKNVEKEYNIRPFDGLESALAESPDVAFICNPSSLHVDIALKCAEAGCDLFIEKPLSNSLEGVERLIGLVASTNRMAMVGYQLRFHPCVQQLGTILQEGRIGRPLAVRAVIGEFLPNWHRYEDYRTMYAARAELGGGVILSQIHELDYISSLFGLPKRVFALGGHWSRLELNVEDVASMLLECTHDGRVLPVHLQADYLQQPPSRQCEVIGDEGKVVIDLIANEIILHINRQTEPERRKVNFERNQLFLSEIDHFLRCVVSRQQPTVTLQDGLQSLRIALAAKESIAGGRVVELDDSTHLVRTV